MDVRVVCGRGAIMASLVPISALSSVVSLRWDARESQQTRFYASLLAAFATRPVHSVLFSPTRLDPIPLSFFAYCRVCPSHSVTARRQWSIRCPLRTKPTRSSRRPRSKLPETT